MPEKIRRLVDLRRLYYFSAALISIRLAVRCIQGGGKIIWPDLSHEYLWTGLSITILCHLVLLGLAWMCTRVFSKLSVAILYPGLLLGFYFLFLVNKLTLRIPEALFSWLLLIGLAVFFLVMRFRSKPRVLPHFIQPRRQDIIPSLLIMLWFIHAGLFFLEMNLQPDRKPYVDETTFWYAAAERMIMTDSLQAHIADYPARNLHPYGIPFIAALPAKIAGFRHPSSAFFMPWSVILTLTIFLFSIRANRWGFLFLLTALFVTFNDRGWLSELLYVRIYGEGLSTVFFLGTCFELRRLSDIDRVRPIEFYTLCFIIGLFALTKFPLAAVWPVFLVPLFIIFVKNRIWLYRVTAILGGLCVALVPLVTWRIFVHQNRILHQLGGFECSWHIILSRLLSPNLNMLSRVYHLALSDTPQLVYFGIISLVFIAAANTKKIYAALLPVVLHIGMIGIYYGYLYNYGKAGGDHASSVRYLMPMVLALFFLGAEGFTRIMRGIEKNPWPLTVKLCAGLIMVGMFLPKLF